jgi:formylglycine-generating enzyme required for sulfatase activity
VAWREVDAGTVEVLVADPCFLPTGERVAVRAGERRTVKLAAKPRLAGLKVNAEDEKGNAQEADVVVDGSVAGPAGSTIKIPACSKKLSVGLGRETFEQKLKMEEGKVTTLTAKPGVRGASLGRMVLIPGGTFQLEKRGDTVSVAPFLIDETEVTAGAACVKAWKCIAEGLSGEYATYGVAGKENHPVNYVDWNRAAAYCAAVGKRLPTEEEWEWAARGTERGTMYPWGNDTPEKQLCWNGTGNDRLLRAFEATCAVGSYPQGDSPEGIKDLAGNVWEWTSTAYDASSRVFRGGGWFNALPSLIVASDRGGYTPDQRNNNLGFRCAKTP